MGGSKEGGELDELAINAKPGSLAKKKSLVVLLIFFLVVAILNRRAHFHCPAYAADSQGACCCNNFCIWWPSSQLWCYRTYVWVQWNESVDLCCRCCAICTWSLAVLYRYYAHGRLPALTLTLCTQTCYYLSLLPLLLLLLIPIPLPPPLLPPPLLLLQRRRRLLLLPPAPTVATATNTDTTTTATTTTTTTAITVTTAADAARLLILHTLAHCSVCMYLFPYLSAFPTHLSIGSRLRSLTLKAHSALSLLSVGPRPGAEAADFEGT